MQQGHEVVIGGDGWALDYLTNYFPSLRYVILPSLHLHYSEKTTQVWTLFKQLPHFLYWYIQDSKAIRQLQDVEHFDMIISDNRFNLINRHRTYHAVYITHQLHIAMPHGMRWAAGIAQWWHRQVIERYDECWVPDYEQFPGLAGLLSHPKRLPHNIKYIGCLSRFSRQEADTQKHEFHAKTLAIISGLEPQRSIFEQQIRKAYSPDEIVIIDGKPPYPTDDVLASYIIQAKHIISRSGYSSIMDYAALGVLDKVKMMPTLGQPEQEYLAQLHNN